MKKVKKLLAVLMLVCMLMSILPMGTVAFADGSITFQCSPTTAALVVKTAAGEPCSINSTGNGEYRFILANGDYRYSASAVGYISMEPQSFTIPYSSETGTVIPVNLQQCTDHVYDDKYSDGLCNICSLSCPHNFGDDSVCDDCHFKCNDHTYNTSDAGNDATYCTGNCTICGMAHTPHSYPDTYTDGKCTICGAACTHNFGDDSVCDLCHFKCTAHTYNTTDEDNAATYCTGNCEICGAPHVDSTATPPITHVYDQVESVNADGDGRCNTCGLLCTHSYPTTYTDGKCTLCGFSCAHSYPDTYTDGKCTICHKSCTHEFPDTYTDGKCTLCHYVCTNHVDANSDCQCDTCHAPVHNYVNGVCTKNAEHRQTVATIGDVGYTSLAAAFSGAGTGDTIKIIASVTETPAAAITTNATTLTLELNTDYTLAGTYGYIPVDSGVTFAITGTGRLISTGAAGAVKLDGGRLTTNANITGAPAITMLSGDLQVTGGTLSGGTSQPALDIRQSGDCSVIIDGGTLSGSYSIKHVGNDSMCTIYINGGTFNNQVYSSNNSVIVHNNVALPRIAPDSTGLVNAGNIHKGAANIIETSGDKVSIPKSGIAAASNGGSISITTGKGSATFTGVALSALTTADTDISFEIKDISTADETTAGTKHFSLKLNNGAITSFNNGSVTVKLNVGTTAPKELVHTKGDGTLEYFYPTAHGSHGVFTYTSPYAEFNLTSFSDITANLRTTGLPEIVTTALSNAVVDTAYTATLAAHGANTTADPMTWTVVDPTTNPLPSWLNLSTAGVLTGIPPAAAAAVTFTVRATNSLGSDDQQLSITVVESSNYEVYDPDTDTSSYFSTFAAAHDAASAGDSIIAHVDKPDENITISKSITFDGGNHSIGTISVTGTTTPTIRNVKSSMLNAASPSNPTLTGANVISTLVSNPGSTVTVTNGTYEHLYGSSGTSAANHGSYVVSGGSFGASVPIDYCLRVENSTTSVDQYNSVKSGNRWVIKEFVPEITAVDHSAYFVYRSANTLGFTTNIPYTLTDDGTVTDPPTADSGDIYRVTITRGGTTKTIRSSYYTLGKNDNGNTVVTLSNSYLRSLTNDAEYTLNIVTKEGTASDTFKVSSTGKTGDTSNLGMWMWIMGGSVLVLCVAAGFVVYKSKKKKK